jgi:hypothetical protein
MTNFETMYFIMVFFAKSVFWYSVLISMMSLLPAILGSELGFRRWYIKFLVNLFDWATKRIQIHNDEMNENDPKTAPPKIAEKIATRIGLIIIF